MKRSLLLIFLLTFTVHAEPPSAIPGDGIGDTQPEESVAYGQAVESEEGGMLDKLRETEPVKSQYTSCTSEKQNDSSAFATTYPGGMGDCVWSKLDDTQKEQVQQMVEFAQEDESGRTPAGQEEDKKQFDGVNLVNAKRTQLDPVDEKVQEFFAKKIVEGLYGDGSDNKRTLVKHDNFYQLYKSRLSKNILEAISSFCVEAIPVSKTISDRNGSGKTAKFTGFVIPQASSTTGSVKLRKLVRKWNIENMQHTMSAQGNGPAQNTAQAIWNACMVNIDRICTETGNICATKGPDGQCQEKINGSISSSYNDRDKVYLSDRMNSGGNGPVSIDDLIKKMHQASGAQGTAPAFDPRASETETKGKACQVSQYLKGARQSLAALEKLDEKMEEKRKGGAVIGYQMEVCKGVEKGKCKDRGEVDNYNAGDKEKGIDSLTTLTSKEAAEESGMKDAQKGLEEEYKKCKESQDEETCKKFLATNRTEQEGIVDEYDIRSRAMLAKIEKLKKEKSKDGLTQYLKEEGYSEDQISEMTSDDAKVEKLWTSIEEKYKNARKNLVDSMRRRMEGNTTKKDEQIVFSGQDNDKGAIDTIAAELTDKTDRYADLVHFNNIVSGYLEVGSGDEAKRNTASLFAEIESAGEGRQEAAAEVRRAANEAGISDERDNENTDPASLGIEEINEHILNHD